ncbi:hypothetical protein RM697_06795 [Ichthyenterobacterium sp. W332]|uniref:Uncharacterized protein n=1 Tax=Microcosmobacter mediterraneus TaxID=3075607 RepID=A0ABU2YKJ0_9FLAO|nr:hypothetical protein [Ichthyenterobacterium sp. W332]MDT0558345.1 hypothetical protein [Ichthyenterobacterium sp. W332]
MSIFAIVHLIHFMFLATNVCLNEIPLEIPKVIGGALAYLMIVVAPLKFNQLSKTLQVIYFYYVSLVMILTYVARIKGDFKGAEPFWFHYVAFSILLLFCMSFGFELYQQFKKKPLH